MMGRASNRKKNKRDERMADAQKLRVVVCAYPDRSLRGSLELLKAATVYGDEVVLHHPTATMLASVASLGELAPADLVDVMRTLVPALGQQGATFGEAMRNLEEAHGPESVRPVLQALLEPNSDLHRIVLQSLDPMAAAPVSELARQFADVRRELTEVIERQLVDAGMDALVPAIDAGLLRLAPIEESGDFFESYLAALWSVLDDRRYYPLLDGGMAELARVAIDEGSFAPSPLARSRARQAGAASEFLARLPTFPLAEMDEIVDIRSELSVPLVRFRAEMVRVASDLDVDAYDARFEEAAEQAWREKVQPALLELEEMVEERRLRRQFGVLPTSGVVGAAGGLIAGLITKAPLPGGVAALGGAGVVASATVVRERARLDDEMRKRPYFLLHKTESLLASR